ncbi:NAD(P)-dependent oxidoreductase, partial [Stenotrophomonas maltophilia]|uniref:NAD(P)-dependent oxidoreductase n=1 Tax=Stenotrophomonas maltophilia TaxID=40324 RepID=UPI00195310E6
TKLMINLIVGSVNGALAEALNFGQRNGLDWVTMIDTIADSVVASPYIASKVDKLKQRDWTAAARSG